MQSLTDLLDYKCCIFHINALIVTFIRGLDIKAFTRDFLCELKVKYVKAIKNRLFLLEHELSSVCLLGLTLEIRLAETEIFLFVNS